MKKTIYFGLALLSLSFSGYAETSAANSAVATHPSNKPAAASTASQVAVKPMPIDCFWEISATPLSDLELTLWAQYAALKSFEYTADNLDAQLTKLKSCYTDQGWLGFNEALKQSGNLTTIKKQQLSVSSQLAGKPEVNTIKADQWRITIPLDVVYQNTQGKLTQSLSVVMVVTKKSTKQLGIVQLIAAPQQKEGENPV